jgi:hypothetical protein
MNKGEERIRSRKMRGREEFRTRSRRGRGK